MQEFILSTSLHFNFPEALNEGAIHEQHSGNGEFPEGWRFLNIPNRALSAVSPVLSVSFQNNFR